MKSSAMKNIDQIDSEIKKLHDRLDHIEGTKTEVYTRIVGYYRSVANWNKGKREEYSHREPFTKSIPEGADGQSAHLVSAAETPAELLQETYENAASYIYFFRKSCPNCPPVKAFLENLDLPGSEVNVDTQEGEQQAAGHQVMAAPTVILFDQQGKELYRAHSVQNLNHLFSPTSIEL